MTKLKQRAVLLQKKLAAATKEEKRVREEVERLEKELAETKLAVVRKQVDLLGQRMGSSESSSSLSELEVMRLFSKEREILYELIQEGPSPQAFEAQVELDRILRLVSQERVVQ